MKTLLTVIAVTASLTSVAFAGGKAEVIRNFTKTITKISDDGEPLAHLGDVGMAAGNAKFELRTSANKNVTRDILTNSFDGKSEFKSTLRLKTTGTSPSGLYNLSEKVTLEISQTMIKKSDADAVVKAVLKNTPDNIKVTHRKIKVGKLSDDTYRLEIKVELHEMSVDYMDDDLVVKLINEAHAAVLKTKGVAKNIKAQRPFASK